MGDERNILSLRAPPRTKRPTVVRFGYTGVDAKIIRVGGACQKKWWGF